MRLCCHLVGSRSLIVISGKYLVLNVKRHRVRRYRNGTMSSMV